MTSPSTTAPSSPHRRAYENRPATSRAPGARPVALVTGGARRIGRAIALELAGNGHDIALHLRRADPATQADAAATAAELRQAGARVELFVADFDDDDATAGLVPAVARSFGRLDVLVNNASRFEYDNPAQFEPTLLAALVRSNTTAPVVLARALSRQVAAQAPLAGVSPCVINLLDQKLANPNPDYFSYTLTKAALQHATVLLAQALAPAIRVCGVSPGLTMLSGPMNDSEFERAHALTPLGRSSTPEDIARAVCFLAQSPAITGVDLAVDGGQHLAAQARDVLFLARAEGASASA